MRFLFYSHDGCGLGHTRRHLAIAQALTDLDPHASVLLASGADDAYRFGLPARVEVLKLPAVRKVRNGYYVSRHLDIPAVDVHALRSELLRAAVTSYRPAVLLVDKHPFGASNELQPALDAMRGLDGRTVLGLRDILDDRENVLREWGSLRDEIAGYFDLVLVYGERAIFDPVAEYELPADVAARTRFCGYVFNRTPESAQPKLGNPGSEIENHRRALLSDFRYSPFGFFRSATATPARPPQPMVVATVGGGEDGFALLKAFVLAATGAPWQAIAVAGPMTPEAEFQALQTLANDAGVTLHRFMSDLPGLFQTADALVCMGGYNTLVEATANGVPTVCVPRVSPRREQAMRAAAFERLGLLRMLLPSQLTAGTLRDAVCATLATPRSNPIQRPNLPLQLNGARQAAHHLRALAYGNRARRAGVATLLP